MSRCKECDRPLSKLEGFEFSDNATTLLLDGRAVHVEPTLYEMASTLAAKGTMFCRYAEMIAAMYGATSYRVDANNLVKVHASRLRSAISPFGWTVENSWGIGYRLSRIEDAYGRGR